MAEFKLVIGTKDGKSSQKEVKDVQAKPFLGKKIGDTVKGEGFDMPGYEFMICGGSDNCGFPMRKDNPGTARRRILAVTGVGLKKKRDGQRQRKTVCGNTIHGAIAQINLKVMKAPKEAAKSEGAEEPAAAEAKPAKEKSEKKK